MEVQDWGGGLTQHEVEAIEKIKQAFQASENNKKVKGRSAEFCTTKKNVKVPARTNWATGAQFPKYKQNHRQRFSSPHHNFCRRGGNGRRSKPFVYRQAWLSPVELS